LGIVHTMSEQKQTNTDLDLEFDVLCCAAAEGDVAALQKLLAALHEMSSPSCKISNERKCQREESLELVAASMSGTTFSDAEIEFLASALAAGFDTPVFRDRYAAVGKQRFNQYGNPAGLAEAIGFRDSDTPLDLVRKRIEVMKELKVGSFCHDPAFGTGTVVALDDLSNEVTVSIDRKRILRLRSFFDTMMIVKADSPLHTLLNQNKLPASGIDKKYLDSLHSSLLCAGTIPNGIVKKILVPAFLTEERYDMIASGNESSNDEEFSAAAEAAVGIDPRSWDNSRSIDELVERLKSAKLLTVIQPNLQNVRNLFSSVAHRPELSESFAMSAAMILKGEVYNDFLAETMKALAEKAEVWNNINLFVEVCDKLPGKLVPFWLKASQLAKGSEYLATATLLMPYRLWGYVEKLLAENPDEKNLLSEHVYQAFKEGKVTPEHYVWLWKAPKSELRSKYLSNSYLLFKTLHAEARGSYLKSKRLLHKMLLDDEQFQREVMHMGDPDAIKALVRCVKHQPLLDKSERQSLLVKIVRHYPEAIHEVEERGRSTRRAIANITSMRSYEQAKHELENLINVLIPENVAAIEYARSLGDLRENSEFKYAKERQAFLSKRRAELESRLAETRPFDFSEVEVDETVVPGCSVMVKYPSGKQEQFHVLGRFDSKPEENKIAYDSPLGKVLIGATLQEELQMPSGDKAVLVTVKPLSKEMLEWLNSKPE
jgi:transcription elongation GreA/GreB family factor